MTSQVRGPTTPAQDRRSASTRSHRVEGLPAGESAACERGARLRLGKQAGIARQG
jgi:hypothetical protein